MADTLRIDVPRLDWNGRATDMRSRLVTWEWFWRLPRGRTRVELDFSRVSFMEPWALAMFAAYGAQMRQSGTHVDVILDPANPANLYSEAMGLRDLILHGSSASAAAKWSDSHQNTGLHVVRDERDIAAFRRSAARLALAHCEEAADALKWAMTELSRNVIQHSGSAIGGVAIAQHFPERKALQVAIVDVGQGLKSALHNRYPELRNDMDALRLGVLPHSSGAAPAGPYGDSLRNAGLGLFTCKEIAWRAGGSFWLASGRALLGVRGDLDSVWQSEPTTPAKVYRTIEPWLGAAVVVDFPVDGVADFAGITRLWQGLADEARRMPGPSGVDFVSEDVELPEGCLILKVLDFDEDVGEAERVRSEQIKPRVLAGEPTLLDFSGVRAPTQSFVHALLYETFVIPGSLLRLSFRGCTPTAREVVKAVAAYASYRQII